MTVNQYKCKDCKAEFEFFEESSSNLKCLGCGSKELKKVGSRELRGGCDCSSCPGCGH